MKNTILMFSVFLGLILISCKKETIRETTTIQSQSNISTFTVYNTNWITSNQFQIATIMNSAITQDIVDNGAVLVYLKENSNWVSLPLTYYGNAAYSTTIRVDHNVGFFKVYRSNSDLSTPGNPGNQTYKCVLISGEQLAQNPNVNLNSYKEVIEVLINDK